MTLDNETYNEVQKFLRHGTDLWARLLVLESCGCTLAGTEAKRIRDLMDDITRKMEDMAA